MIRQTTTIGLLVSIMFALCACGCEKRATTDIVVTGVPHISALDPKSFAADMLPYENAALILAGKPLPVKMSSKRSGEVLIFKLDAFGQTVEEEVYRLSDRSFSVERVSDELYDPPIPLIEYPAHSGERYEWAGEMVSGEQSRQAKANIELLGDRLNMFGGQFESLHVMVNLQMESGGPDPAVRTMSFWFVPGKGMVKREFGFSSTREPAPAEQLE